MAKEPASDLFPGIGCEENVCVINERCMIRSRREHRLVIVSGIVLAQYAFDDRMAEAHAMVSLVEQGWANQKEVALAFGCSTRKVRRDQRRFEEGGLAALGQQGGYPLGRCRIKRSHAGMVRSLKAEGMSNRQIAREVGVSETAIRKTLRRLGWVEAAVESLPLPLDPQSTANSTALEQASSGAVQASSECKSIPSSETRITPHNETPRTLDTDPLDRSRDRLLAYMGLIDDAAPLFGSQSRVARAGVLLALPPLIESGVFECAQQIYGGLGPAFYGLRNSVLTLLLMALWRIKRPEGLKEHSPQQLGRILGLDRAPEVKTVRRKLNQLAAAGGAADLGRALARRRIAARGEALGFLYVDGHVRVYHGKHRLPKAHVPRMRLSMPATTDYWVNDSSGDPLLVLTAELNAGLGEMLPAVLKQVRSLIGERRVTVVFDRGGFNFKLFKQILEAGFDLLTYRKGRFRRIPRNRFVSYDTDLGGTKTTYLLADQEVRLNRGKLRLRQVTRLSDNGHQTPILTSRRDLPTVQVAYRMFDRWRQENFFKYLREEYALDALADYDVEPADHTRQIPNPEWKAADTKLRQAYAQLERLEAEYGLEAFSNVESKRRTMRGFKIAQRKLGDSIDRVMKKIATLQKKRAALPRRIALENAPGE